MLKPNLGPELDPGLGGSRSARGRGTGPGTAARCSPRGHSRVPPPPALGRGRARGPPGPASSPPSLPPAVSLAGSPAPGFLFKMASPVAAQARKLLRDLALRPPLLATRSQVSGPRGRAAGRALTGRPLARVLLSLLLFLSLSWSRLRHRSGATPLEATRGAASRRTRPSRALRSLGRGARADGERQPGLSVKVNRTAVAGVGSPSPRGRRLALHHALRASSVKVLRTGFWNPEVLLYQLCQLCFSDIPIPERNC